MKKYDNAYAIIMAGGEGRRLWPLSTPALPKQFISIFGGKSLIRHAVERVNSLIPPERTFIVTSSRFTDLTRHHLPEIPRCNIIGEPCRRDTAGVVAIACALVKRLGGDDAVGCILPADHIIKTKSQFTETLKKAISAASSSKSIVTVGIPPDRPAEEYGYIETAAPSCKTGLGCIEPVKRFVEKPDAKTAKRYLKSGRFLWNAGMFVWRAKSLEDAFTGASDIGKMIKPLAEAKNFSKTLEKLYPSLKSISFDYAVMEKAADILVVRSSFSWDDVGGYLALTRHLSLDKCNNATSGNCMLVDTESSIIISNGAPGHVLAVAGLKDMIVAHTGEATIVMPKKKAGSIKLLADSALKALNQK